MINQLVPYWVAKELYNMKFNGECFAQYDSEKKLELLDPKFLVKNDSRITKVTAPTWEHVSKWIFEKYKYLLEVRAIYFDFDDELLYEELLYEGRILLTNGSNNVSDFIVLYSVVADLNVYGKEGVYEELFKKFTKLINKG